jgi:hypothetical protein
MEVVRNVTIFLGTKKRLVKRFVVEPRPGYTERDIRIRYLEKNARTRWWTAWGMPIVVVEGWDHPEFDPLIRGFREAPVQHGPAGVKYKMISVACVVAGEEPVKSTYELEFEAYLHSLDSARIIFDSRRSAA